MTVRAQSSAGGGVHHVTHGRVYHTITFVRIILYLVAQKPRSHLTVGVYGPVGTVRAQSNVGGQVHHVTYKRVYRTITFIRDILYLMALKNLVHI